MSNSTVNSMFSVFSFASNGVVREFQVFRSLLSLQPVEIDCHLRLMCASSPLLAN